MMKNAVLSVTRQNVFHDIIECLVAALEAKDAYTSGHSNRVADMADSLAKQVGLTGIELENVHYGAHLHDIGKIGIPEYVLNKKEALLLGEWKLIQKHPQIGYNILHNSKYLQDIAEIVLHHHERWDGKGYPSGLSGEEIPLGSRIIAVCDTIDAMTSDRPYRCAFSFAKTREEIRKNKGFQFDPLLVETAETLWPFWENMLYVNTPNEKEKVAVAVNLNL